VYIIISFIIIIFLFRPWYFIPKGIRNCEGGKNHEPGVSRLTTSHFRIKGSRWLRGDTLASDANVLKVDIVPEINALSREVMHRP